MVLGLQSDGLGELGAAKGLAFFHKISNVKGHQNIHSLVEVLLGNRLVAQSLELVCGSHLDMTVKVRKLWGIVGMTMVQRKLEIVRIEFIKRSFVSRTIWMWWGIKRATAAF